MQHPPRPTEIAHHILRRHLVEGDHAIDATAGNGHDTLFLAGCVGATGIVHAIDIQESAITAARALIHASGLSSRVHWHIADHRHMGDLFPANTFSAVVFNLGYLPGGDHQITTSRPSTLDAIQAAASLLRAGGLLSVLCYPGHPEGALEAQDIASLWPTWSSHGWRIARYDLPFTASPSPVLWIARKPSP